MQTHEPTNTETEEQILVLRFKPSWNETFFVFDIWSNYFSHMKGKKFVDDESWLTKKMTLKISEQIRCRFCPLAGVRREITKKTIVHFRW